MNKYHVKAFTILEMSITMLITTILIAITYTSYSIMVKTYRSFTAKNDEMAVIVSLDHVLKRDFERAEVILKDSYGVSLKKNDILIKYEFKPDFIVRYAVKNDTFKVEMKELKTAFENIPINEVQTQAEKNRIDELDFTFLYQNKTFPNSYHKFYSSANLIIRNPDAIN